MKLAASLGIFISLIVWAGPLIIQIIVCKNTKGRWGLVIPVLSLLLSVFAFLGQYSYDSIGSEENGIFTILFSFLLANIPTLIYYLIYRRYRLKRKEKDELDKMEIMDM